MRFTRVELVERFTEMARPRRADRRRRSRHRSVGQVRGGRRHRPDRHLQLRAATGWPAAVRWPGCWPTATPTRSSWRWRAEVLPVVRHTPVLAGVNGTDPFMITDRFLRELADLGFAGIQNFPTVGLIDGVFRANLEETGMGYGLEVELVAAARAADLLTTPVRVLRGGRARHGRERGGHPGLSHGPDHRRFDRRGDRKVAGRLREPDRRVVGCRVGCPRGRAGAVPRRARLRCPTTPPTCWPAPDSATASTAPRPWSGCPPNRRSPPRPASSRLG